MHNFHRKSKLIYENSLESLGGLRKLFRFYSFSPSFEHPLFLSREERKRVFYIVFVAICVLFGMQKQCVVLNTFNLLLKGRVVFIVSSVLTGSNILFMLDQHHCEWGLIAVLDWFYCIKEREFFRFLPTGGRTDQNNAVQLRRIMLGCEDILKWHLSIMHLTQCDHVMGQEFHIWQQYKWNTSTGHTWVSYWLTVRICWTCCSSCTLMVLIKTWSWTRIFYSINLVSRLSQEYLNNKE